MNTNNSRISPIRIFDENESVSFGIRVHVENDIYLQLKYYGLSTVQTTNAVEKTMVRCVLELEWKINANIQTPFH